MSDPIYDAQTTCIRSPLGLALFVCHHLLRQGYGRLRFYSFSDFGLWVRFYVEMEGRGQNGEVLGLPPFWIGRYKATGEGVAETCFDTYVAGGLTVAQAADAFQEDYSDALAAARSEPAQGVVEWFDALLDCLLKDGLPITPPYASGIGTNGHCSFVHYLDNANRRNRRIPLCPGTAGTVFPFEEYERWARVEASRHKAARYKSNYEEWKRRVAQIDAKQTK